MNSALIALLVSIALSILLSASKNAKTVELQNGDIILTYANSIKGFAIFLSLLLTGGFVFILFTLPIKTESDKYAFVVMFVIVILFALYFYIEFFTVKIILKSSGIVGTSGWRGKRSYDWAEITDITYSPLSMWFKITAINKPPLRVHGLITGIDKFQIHFMSNLPEGTWIAAYEKATKDSRISK